MASEAAPQTDEVLGALSWGDTPAAVGACGRCIASPECPRSGLHHVLDLKQTRGCKTRESGCRHTRYRHSSIPDKPGAQGCCAQGLR
jgi:hypothetical protein